MMWIFIYHPSHFSQC